MKKNLLTVIIALLGAVIFTSGLLSVTFAKYSNEIPFADGVSIAGFGTLELHEHEVKETDGVYELTDKIAEKENKYDKVIPGVDIPKDPYIILKGKFEVSFRVYVKILEADFPKAKIDGEEKKTVTYELAKDAIAKGESEDDEQAVDALSEVDSEESSAEDFWKKDEELTNEKNGEYVYYHEFTVGDLEDLPLDKPIYILKDNKITVSQYYVGDKSFSLAVSAWVAQVD